MSLLLPVIYITFVSLGLPDSAVGAAWPTMYVELGAGVSWQGIITLIIGMGTITSSLLAVRLVERLGVFRTIIGSVALTALALVGFSTVGSFWQICLWAIPYGLGAGAIDAALNTYVSIHYAARHMSWLHCMWGVGASAGPLVMAACLARGTWHLGFLAIGIIQFVIVGLIAPSRKLWAKAAAHASEDGESLPPSSRRQLLRLPGVREVFVCFFCYCALESSCGMWAASYCTLARGISASEAAGWASLFYLGITAGRAASGFLTLRFDDKAMIRLGQALVTAGIVLVLLPVGNATLLVGLVMIGCGCAPIYPSIIHATPARFGEQNALSITGMQMAFAYVGSVMAPLFGLVAEFVSIGLYPFYLAVILVLMVVMAERANRIV